jgi:hypothetical protein
MDDSAWGVGTIWASHIEQPTTCFLVTFWDSRIANTIHVPTGERTVRVFAQTPTGALAVAQFHFGGRGRDFRIVEGPEGGEQSVQDR